MSAAARDPASPRDPLYGRDQQKAFCARLREFGYNYAAVASSLERIGLPRPSAGTGAYRALLATAARSKPGDDPHELADFVAVLYRPAAHLWLPPAPEADGYLVSLLEAEPAVCAAPAPAPDITICDGVRVFWPVVACRWPVIGESGVCCEVVE